MKFRSFETQTRRRTEQIWSSKYENCPAFDSRCLDGGPLRRSPPHVDVAGAGGKKKGGTTQTNLPSTTPSVEPCRRKPLTTFSFLRRYLHRRAVTLLRASSRSTPDQLTRDDEYWKIRRYIFDELLLRGCTQNTFPYLRNGRND